MTPKLQSLETDSIMRFKLKTITLLSSPKKFDFFRILMDPMSKKKKKNSYFTVHSRNEPLVKRIQTRSLVVVGLTINLLLVE